MIIYIAGNAIGAKDEIRKIKQKQDRLYSYHYIKEVESFIPDVFALYEKYRRDNED